MLLFRLVDGSGCLPRLMKIWLKGKIEKRSESIEK